MPDWVGGGNSPGTGGLAPNSLPSDWVGGGNSPGTGGLAPNSLPSDWVGSCKETFNGCCSDGITQASSQNDPCKQSGWIYPIVGPPSSR